MKKYLLRTATCALILGGLAACQSDDALTIATPEQMAQELEKRFDFNNYKTLPLSLNASPLECVKLYSVDPQQNPDAASFFTAVMNSDGKFSVDLPFPGHLLNKTVWAKGNNGVIKGTLTNQGLKIISQSRTINVNGLPGICAQLKKTSEGYLEPGHYNVNILESQMTDIDLKSMDDSGIEVKIAMIDHGDQHRVRLYYYYYTGDDPITDCESLEGFKSKFLTDKFRLFPRADYENVEEYDYWMTEGYNSDANIGKSVQLTYYDADGNPSEKFPAGTKIGFMLYSKEHTDDNEWIKLSSGGAYSLGGRTDKPDTKYAAAMGIATLMSLDEIDDEFNESVKKGDISSVIYTFEDATEGGDWDMDDVKFLALVKGKMASNIPDIPSANGHFRGYYCFEDLYPDQAGGDYDMNDVIVSYDYYYILGQITGPDTNYYGESNDARVIYFDYKIKPIHDGATYTNDFFLKYNAHSLSDLRASTTSKEIYKDHASQFTLNEGKKEGIVFGGFAATEYNPTYGKYTNIITGKSDDFAKGVIFASLDNIMGPVKYNDKYNNDVVHVAGINPYIFCQTTGKEVHLSTFTWTGLGETGFNEGETMEEYLLRHYLTNYDTGNSDDIKYKYCPFAINIPECDGTKFHVTPEGKPIYEAFPNFVEWVESGGKACTDWYATVPYGAEETEE